MTGAIKLTVGSSIIDFSSLNCTVQYTMNNPIFVVPLGSGNQFAMNLALTSTRITLTFDLVDGLTGVFAQLLGIVNSVIAPTLTWGTYTYTVTVESFVASTQPGKLNYMPGCSLVLVPHEGIPGGY